MRDDASGSWLARHSADDSLVNLAGDYDYLTDGYYVSQEAEVSGEPVHPTCEEVLDAYIAPLFLERARGNGLPIPEYYLTNDWFEPPVLIDTVNPFMNRQRIVRSPRQQEKAARSLTRNYTYAICCQELLPGARVRHFQAVLGWSGAVRFRPLAAAVWGVFRIPIARVRVIEQGGRDPQLSGLWPLPWRRLGERERRYVEGVVQWLP
jgi:hypothetical protein